MVGRLHVADVFPVRNWLPKKQQLRKQLKKKQPETWVCYRFIFTSLFSLYIYRFILCSNVFPSSIEKQFAGKTDPGKLSKSKTLSGMDKDNV